jgi:hypothetical protein
MVDSPVYIRQDDGTRQLQQLACLRKRQRRVEQRHPAGNQKTR